MIARFLFSLTFLFLLISNALSANELNPDQQKEVRTLINLLDYIAKDYAMAIEDGEVINEFEYAEMSEFSQQLLDIHDRLDEVIEQKSFDEIKSGLLDLQNQVNQKVTNEEIRGITQSLRSEVLAMNLINVTPTSWPNLSNGERIYMERCASCHGKTGTGDGELSQGLDPAPSNFIDEAAFHVAPLQVYNTARLGIEGTSMVAFPMLSDQEIWDVAFFIKTLGKDSTQVAEALPEDWNKDNALRTAALNSDAELEKILADKNITTNEFRQFQPQAQSGEQTLQKAYNLIAQSKEAFENGDYVKAESLALNAYLDGVEPVESNLRAIDPALVNSLEKEMIDLRSALKENDASVPDHYDLVDSALQNASSALKGHDDSWLFNFWAAFTIIFREALEALLIVGLILGVLKSIGAKDAVPYVHFGWVSAVLIGAAGFLAVDQLLAMGGKNRELMEGIGSLVAVVVLLYVGYWLHSTTKVKGWTSYIKDKVERLLGSGKKWALGGFVFIVVFREAFESVIFLSSLSMGSENKMGLGLGVLAAAILIAVLSVLVLRYSQRLPLTSLFKYSAMAILVLAVVLVGKGVHEFQESGTIFVNSLPFHFDIPLVGLYATWETIISQIVVALVGILLWNYGHLLNRRTPETA